jgi:hypothetical protein
MRCEELGIPSAITEITIDQSSDWAEICRKKIPFFYEAWKQHPNGILWVDVDTNLLRTPDFVGGAHIDFGAMLRGHKYFRGFDPLKMTRLFAPTYLYFGPTENAGKFLEHMASLEREMTGVVATDDFFLHEAWITFKGQLNIQLFPPRIESIDGKGMHLAPYFAYGRSGQVKEFAAQVAQHVPELYSEARLKDTLGYLLKRAEAQGDAGDSEFYANALKRLAEEAAAQKA